MKPYIGIAALTDTEHTCGAINSFQGLGCETHDLMVGLITSHNSILGLKKSPEVMMPGEIEAHYLCAGNRSEDDIVFTLHHFSKPWEEGLRSRKSELLSKPLHEQVGMLIEKIWEKYEREKPSMRMAVQLNNLWPEPGQITRLREDFPGLEVVISVQDSGNAGKVHSYQANHVLFDPSRGFGKEFRLADVRLAYDAMKGNGMLVGVAGGLSHENVAQRILSLGRNIFKNHNFSIDATSGLRTNGCFDPEKGALYLESAAAAFRDL